MLHLKLNISSKKTFDTTAKFKINKFVEINLIQQLNK